jgi:2-oxoglutarate ferredoxin oxidoreductase subunit beta
MPDGAKLGHAPGVEVLTAKEYKSGVKPTWCPGCGDFGVLSATAKSLAALQLPRHEVVVVSGIGCSSRTPYFMRTYGFHSVHGRAVPVATGMKLANPDLTILVMGNQTYGLTKAQSSPTSAMGHKSKSTPYGVVAKPIDPVLFALANGATFVARGYSARPNELSELIAQGIRHSGFSFIHVQSPCAEFLNTYDYYDEHVEDLPSDWDRHDLKAALETALTEEKVHLGVFYEEERPVYGTAVRQFEPEPKQFDLAEYLKRFS